MSTAAPLQAIAAKPPLSTSFHNGRLLQKKCACGSPMSSLNGECTQCKGKKRPQTKLAIGASNDPLEQEADRVADQVMAVPTAGSAPARIRRVTASPSGETGTTPDSVDHALAGSGKPLEPSLRRHMERRFGHDFSQVRVHSGAVAEQSTRDVNAKAYTVGRDIVFGTGSYEPSTHEGRRLIAHELTHVVQQSASNNTPIQSRTAPALQRAPSGEGGRAYEAGAIGSLQFCVNFCNGDFEVIGWVWLGGGTRVLKTFVGPSVMYEGTVAKGNEPSLALLKSICGECDPQCAADKGYLGDTGVAAGIPFFGDLMKGSKKIALASLECGALIVPHSKCNIDVELICFANLLPYMGAVGKGLSTFAEKIGAEAKAGIDGGVTLEFCKAADGRWVMPKAQVCLGAFVEFGWVKETPPGKSPPKKSAPPKDPTPAPSAPPKPHDVEPLDPKLIV
jgi:hypothetical protein